ncbi:MAG: glycosyltransferase [Bacteroidales bacterium]|nr:glycosyltransferase [Candidatus Physcousia equi]
MKISIITICYNNLEGLRLTAESIGHQTVQDFEWIVVDGASTDGTIHFLSTLTRKPDLLISEPDQGIYDAMNKGMRRASGTYQLYLNSGDYLYNDRIMEHMQKMEMTADVVYGDLEFVSKKGRGIGYYSRHITLPYLIQTALGHPSSFIKSSAIRRVGGYDARQKIVADWRLWIELCLQGCTFQHCGLCISSFVVGGVSSTQKKQIEREKQSILAELSQKHSLVEQADTSQKRSLVKQAKTTLERSLVGQADAKTTDDTPQPSCVVVIPVYKPQPSALELLSFRQNLKVLHRHPICIVSHQDCDLSVYADEAARLGVHVFYRYFSQAYFTSVADYNRLMLSPSFYKLFATYQYVLICQLDALVFRDELDDWCARGYDYIGAPIHFRHPDGSVSHRVWGVGNGGLSLRRVAYCLDLLAKPKHLPFMKLSGLCRRYKMRWHTILGLLPRLLGQKNTLGYFLRKNVNEDLIFGVYASHSYYGFRIPDEATARRFSVESFPLHYFPQPQSHMPFGCHAFDKNECESYWLPLIDEQCQGQEVR